jgi:photosystem II stability/assembly factor-like uncharacterized protein
LQKVRLFGLLTSAASLAGLLGCGSDGSGAPSKSSDQGGGGGAANAAGANASAGGGSSAGGKSSSAGGKGSGGGGGGKAGSNGGSGGSPVTPRPPPARDSDDDCRITPEPGDLPAGLMAGSWKNISPPGADFANTFGANGLDIDPTNPLTIYASLDQGGIWKSSDAGDTWAKLGDPSATGKDATSYIDSPLRVAVDPCESAHLYATEGVRGNALGFWVSIDGGATWKRPKGFLDILAKATEDVTTLAVDPKNFSHILLGSHSAWPGQDGAGVLESRDFGETWTMLGPPGGFQAGSIGIGFGSNSDTWIVNGDNSGTWRTTDAGETWKKVSDLTGTHGGSDLYRDSSGALFLGGFGSPYKSTDDGATWTAVSTGLSYGYYLSVGGDGKRLYTAPSFPSAGRKNNQPIFTSPEGDGATWTELNAQRFDNGPYRLRFDSVNGVMYSANWQAGVWALKVAP